MDEKLDIILNDKNFVAINKRSGVIVNRADTTKNEITLQDIIDKSELIDKNDTDEGFLKRSGIVHRLDKETSGILLVAKNSKTFYELQRQFKQRLVRKSYLALVHGAVVPKEGVIDTKIGRLPWNRKRFGVVAGGRSSQTSYKLIGLYNLVAGDDQKLSLLRLFPKTGRTHQIRVHLKHIGYPIFSDELYAGRKTARNDRKKLQRIFLHASRLIFINPTTKKEVTLESDLPEELKKFLKSLKKIN